MIVQKRIFLIAVVLLLKIFAKGQTYKIDTLRTEYRELDTFHSIAKETFGNFNWTKRFDLPFGFPYYDSTYSHIICRYISVCYFESSPDFDIRLLSFGYEFDNVLDTVNIDSDVRYAYVTKENVKALVIQFTKTRLISDESVSQYDSYVNFQLWFYENGVMEIHFGDVNLDNSPNYVPGEGFYLITSEGQKINTGPEMGILNSHNEEDDVWLNGNWDHFSVKSLVGYLRSIPPKGFVIRFSKKSSSVADVKPPKIKINSNPTHGLFSIDFPFEIKSAILCDVSNNSFNHLVKENDLYDISHLPSGMYILKLHSGNQIFTTKIVKI